MILTPYTGFGSDIFFRKMKHAWETDRDTAGLLLLDQTKVICRSIIRCARHGFYHVTEEDYDDYVSESWIKLWQNMKQFLSDPKNDPDSDGDHYSPAQKYNWARYLVLYEMQHMRDRKMGRNPVGSKGIRITITSLDSHDNDNEDNFSLLDIIRFPGYTPEEELILSSAIQEALNHLFSLPNNTETLVAVGYTILSSALEEKQSMEEYADFLSGHTLGEITVSMEALLNEYGFNSFWLAPLRKRMENEKCLETRPVITAKKLINRRNDIFSTMRQKLELIRNDEEKGELK